MPRNSKSEPKSNLNRRPDRIRRKMDLRLAPEGTPFFGIRLPESSELGVIVSVGTRGEWIENQEYRVHLRVEPKSDPEMPLAVDVFRKKPDDLYKAHEDSQSFALSDMKGAADYLADFGFDIRLSAKPSRSHLR